MYTICKQHKGSPSEKLCSFLSLSRNSVSLKTATITHFFYIFSKVFYVYLNKHVYIYFPEKGDIILKYFFGPFLF